MSDHLPHHVSWEASQTAPQVADAKDLLRAGDVDGAIALLEPLTADESDDHLLFEVLGAAYARKGNLTAAVGAFETAAHLNPAHPQTHYNLGQARLLSGDSDGAREAFERSLRVDPTYGKARMALESMQKAAKA